NSPPASPCLQPPSLRHGLGGTGLPKGHLRFLKLQPVTQHAIDLLPLYLQPFDRAPEMRIADWLNLQFFPAKVAVVLIEVARLHPEAYRHGDGSRGHPFAGKVIDGFRPEDVDLFIVGFRFFILAAFRQATVRKRPQRWTFAGKACRWRRWRLRPVRK